MIKPLTKQLSIYQYVIEQNHSRHEAMEHFKCSESFVSRCVKIESARRGVYVDGRKYVKPNDEVTK